jgi:hypothetical protein
MNFQSNQYITEGIGHFYNPNDDSFDGDMIDQQRVPEHSSSSITLNG